MDKDQLLPSVVQEAEAFAEAVSDEVCPGCSTDLVVRMGDGGVVIELHCDCSDYLVA